MWQVVLGYVVHGSIHSVRHDRMKIYEIVINQFDTYGGLGWIFECSLDQSRNLRNHF